MRVSIDNLVTETKEVYADSIDIEVVLDGPDLDKLKDFLLHMPHKSTVPLKVSFVMSDTLHIEYNKILSTLNQPHSVGIIKKDKWWDHFLT